MNTTGALPIQGPAIVPGSADNATPSKAAVGSIPATDIPADYLDWGRPMQRAIGKVTPQALARHDFAEGLIGLKVEAAHAFVLATGERAVIGSLNWIEYMLAGNAGPQVCTEAAGGADTL